MRPTRRGHKPDTSRVEISSHNQYPPSSVLLRVESVRIRINVEEVDKLAGSRRPSIIVKGVASTFGAKQNIIGVIKPS